MKFSKRLSLACGLTVLLSPVLAGAQTDALRKLVDVPDYAWDWGCFGTGTGNLAGYWDRHGMENVYAGPNNGGIAPLSSTGGNVWVKDLWASPEHLAEYWVAYQTDSTDPISGHVEHVPNCTGDFIGLNQNKWKNMNGECDGNIDGYSFVFWDATGAKRNNYTPSNNIPDIQSGLREWAKWRGYEADTFTQLVDFNPRVPTGAGFHFTDLKREIDQGYPVLIFLQPYNSFSRQIGNMSKANPLIHGMMIYGYGDYPTAGGFREIYYKTSWGVGEHSAEWSSATLEGVAPIRGVIGFRPKPKITEVVRINGNVRISWDGPASQLFDQGSNTTTNVHRFQLLQSTSLSEPNWKPVGTASTNRVATVAAPTQPTFYRVHLQHAN